MKTTVICIKSSNPSVFVVGKEYRLETVYGDQYVNNLRVGPFAVSSTLQHESEDGVFSFERKAKKYYSLLTFEAGRWCIQFGDYKKSVVQDEKEDSYSDEKCKIICTNDDQASIDQKIAELNK